MEQASGNTAVYLERLRPFGSEDNDLDLPELGEADGEHTDWEDEDDEWEDEDEDTGSFGDSDSDEDDEL